MPDYNSAVLDEVRAGSARVLVIGKEIPAVAGAGWSLCPNDGGAAAALRRELPDILVMPASQVDSELAALLADRLFAAMPILLMAGADDADAAGLLLERPLTLLDSPADEAAVKQALEAAVRGLGAGGVADAGGRYEGADHFAALKRDAERVAAALNELVEGRRSESVRPVDAGRIRSHIRARRLRDRFFASDLFADPVWDMLLDLSAARLELRRVSVSSLCIGAHVPTTTALRWIKAMVDQGMLERMTDPSDARRSFISMTAQTSHAMDACLDAVLNHPGQ